MFVCFYSRSTLAEEDTKPVGNAKGIILVILRFFSKNDIKKVITLEKE